MTGLNVRFDDGPTPVHAVRDASFSLNAGRCLALVGESGSGKSVLARSLLGLAGPDATVTADQLRIAGYDARSFGPREWRAVRGRRIGLVAQDALTALDPVRPVGREIAEPLLAHHIVPRRAVRARVLELLDRVGMPEPGARAKDRPHQLSGGQRQRALIASALAADPDTLIADEPTTALDASVQARILRLLGELTRDGMALLLISHDLTVVEALADEVAVVQDGRIVESGPTARVLEAPRHVCTRKLLAAVTGARRRTALPPGPATGGTPLLQVTDVVRTFQESRGVRRTAVDGVSFSLRDGEALGLVGESGSGKSTLARMVLGLLEPDAGSVRLAGEPWSAVPERDRRRRRHALQLVPQDPLSSFDPRWPVARVIGEALAAAGRPRRDRAALTRALLERVGLSPEHVTYSPRALSGGQRQRVALARALASGPRLLVCDEPVSALDVTAQAQVLDLLRKLRAELGLATLFVSHDLTALRGVCERVMVMHDGRIVESGPVAEVFAAPRHPYTRALLEAVPRRLRAVRHPKAPLRLADAAEPAQGRL
ncbi:dipeptide ABC transporter ATP-binding protein [Streptomyces iconiensis]|uniref:ABC transporter ATP-binding protein n=1 Tax=Streptomyces iconiensis TaxID=1384038 RepID=A0ABT7A811_9ACTN|nr:ABC transporter ATP-binding protein [Streptomyces iconiensis]MDJ1137480.1 ABC transporter ATP-binding protein [Streptomyces iconiensis]